MTYTGGSYSHNAAGCVTAIDRTGNPDLALTWNGQYQLTSVSTNGVVAESYTYDPFGRRASTTAGDVTVRHVYDGAHCVADTDATGAVVRSYTWGPGIDNLLAVTSHDGGVATTYYALTDIQGTVHGFADASGELFETYAYDAWGNVLAARDGNGLPIPNQQSQIQNRFLFQGREYSHATGLYNFRLRWYDPATGRWISKDPIGISGGLNLYAFCGNDPVNYVDPWGLEEWYSTVRDASIAGSLAALTLSEKGGKNPIEGSNVNPGREWGGVVFCKKFGDIWLYSYSRPRPGVVDCDGNNVMDFNNPDPSVDPIPEQAVLRAYYHSHPGGSAFFSEGDVSFQESTFYKPPKGPESLVMTCRTKNGPQVFMLNYSIKGFTNPNQPTPIWSNGQSKPVPVKP